MVDLLSVGWVGWRRSSHGQLRRQRCSFVVQRVVRLVLTLSVPYGVLGHVQELWQERGQVPPYSLTGLVSAVERAVMSLKFLF
ncbi:hypothetical protein V6N11_060204 [Hibiscus sabdariffa]|uniref:Uncharacterized protein n=2 Tax=Hibiscus sabdariffa TaxID=183260 RepID=A0ABR2G3D5_9ROSI